MSRARHAAMPERAHGGLLRSSGVMAAGTLVSRLLGMVRVAVLGTAIGATTTAANSFDVANTVPNIVFILIAGGVLNAVLVPQITRASRQADRGQDYLDRLLTLAVALMLAVTIVVTAAAPLLVRLYSSGWSPATQALTTAFALWCLPQVFFYGLYTLFGQVLNARGSFGPYMWSPVLNNLVAIAGLLVYIAVVGRAPRPPEAWTPGQIALLAGTTTLGIVVQAVVLLWPLHRIGFSWRPRRPVRGIGLRKAGTIAGWTFATVLIGQLGFVITSRVTTAVDGLGTASKFAYSTAYLVFMLPHSLAAVSLVTALFTRMSASAAASDQGAVRRDLSLGLRLVGVATVFSTCAVLALSQDIVRVLLFGNSRRDTDAIALVVVTMIIGLVPFSAQYLYQRVFYALEDAQTPFWAQVPVVVITVVASPVCLYLLPARHVVAGLGVVQTVAAVVGAVLTAWLLRRRIGVTDGHHVLRTHVRLVAAGAAAGVGAWLASHGVHALAGEGLAASLLALVVGAVVAVGLYLGACSVMHVEEVGDAVSPLLRRR